VLGEKRGHLAVEDGQIRRAAARNELAVAHHFAHHPVAAGRRNSLPATHQIVPTSRIWWWCKQLHSQEWLEQRTMA